MSNPSDQTQKSVLGPFTKESFNQPKWKQIKEKIFAINSTNEEEALPDVRLFLQFLLDLNAQPDYNKYFGETSIKNFFFEDILPANAKNLIACKYFNNNELLEISNACLKQMILFWFKTLHEDHPKLGDMAKVILDPARTYYKYNNQETLPSSVISGFLTEPTIQQLEWIQTLKEGDLIDCIKIDQTYKKMCWSQAKVAYVMDPHIKVTFLNDHDKTSRYLEKKANAHEIAPHKSKCPDFDWRLALQVGDEIDACDTTHVWYNATVLDSRDVPLDDGTLVRDLYIGYRVYTPDGDRQDNEGKKFSGWSSKYDEWLSWTDPRINKKNSMAKKLYMGSSSNSDDPVVDDSNDKIYNQDGKALYVIIRSNHCKSTFLINLINQFAEMGGFERIYERITDTKNWAPIETVSVLSSVIGNLSPLLHRDFALEYVPRFKEAVWRSLLYGPESNVRNFTKDKIEGIIQAFDALLKRVYSLPEKQEIIESFNLQICCVCFDSAFLERKLQGLKALLQVIKDIRYSSSNQAKFITNSYLNSFLSRNNIFTKIYGSKGHVQLIQRSAEFLKYMLHEDILNLDDFQTIWTATTKGDMEAKLAVYKVLSEISLHLKSAHLDHIITKIAEIQPQEVIAEEIDLVYELCKFSIKPAWFIKKARDFYWQIISDSTGLYAPNIVELTLNKFCEIMRGPDFKDERINVLYDCLDNIRQEVAVLPSLKIMKKLIDHYPTSPASAEKFTKSTCIDHLCKEKGLLGLIIQDLKVLKSNLKAKTENVKAINEQVLDSLVGDRTSYINHITERMQFVHYLLTNNSSGEVTLNYELLSDLWDVIVNNALIPGERDVVYKWIKEVAESKSGFPMSIEDLQKFFKEKMNSKENKDCQAMTKEGFKCFKNVFLVINEKLQKISKVVVAASNNSYSSLYGGYGGSSYYYSSKEKEDTSKKEEEFDYTVNVLPNELEGIDSIWDFILIAEEDGVAEKAIDFLNKLFLHVNSELESKIVEIRKEYLDTCNQRLKETLELQKSLSESAFANRCIRCLRLISSIMDESEKQGVGNLKSHSGLVKGELLTFTVSNDVSTGSDVPKKTEIRMYSNTTVFNLRMEIAKQFKTSWDSVKLMRRTDPKEIKDNENGRTIGEIRLRNNEVLTAAKRPTPPIPQAPLILPDDTLNPIAKKIFLEWFTEHSTDRKMNPDQCAAFIHSCTNDNCKAEDKRVKDVFTTYDDDKDGFLTEENFVKFYQMACKQRPPVVWNNLHSHHYRNDLKKVTEVEQEKVDITSLARYIISANDEYFQLIFSLLGFGGKIAIEAWKLLNRLPTSPQVFSDIVMLKGIRESASSTIEWNSILDLDSKYKLLYALHVIEYLMEDDEADEEEDEDEGQKQIGRLLWARDPKLLEYKKTWQADFIAFGGFDHLFKIFNIFAKQDSSKLKMFDKNILSFVLKILKNYLSAAFAATVPNIYRNLSFIRLFYLSLDFIQDYLNSEHTRPSRENSFKLSQETGEPVLADVRPRAGSKSQIEQGKLPRKDSKAEEKKKEKLKIEESEEFATLVDRLRGDLGSKILSTINLKDLLEVISSLGYNILSDSGDLESEDRMILEYSLSILMAILFFNEEYIKYFLNPENSSEGHQGADKYMLEGVFCPKVLNVRKYFSHAIYVLCRHTVRFQNAFASKYFINLFLNNLPSSAESAKKDCNQYFELLCKLIEETYINDKRPRSLSNVDDNTPLDFKNLLDKVIQQLRCHISTEQRNNLNITDKILVGLLNLCEKILTVQPELRNSLGSQGHNNLVEEIFNICLFDVNDRDSSNNTVALVDSKNYVKCKSKESRSIAYKLLIALCKDHETNMLTLLQCMKNLTATIVKLNTNKGWGYSPSSDTKSAYGFVGIKNLGCICYMNAMLQQFFMTPSFRYALLAADDKKEANWVKKEKFTADDNVLHQLQQMFGFLELSDRQDYNPQEFCFAFKDHAGQPVNVSVQQDTQEFLNMIFDKLEHGLKQTPFRHILEGVYGGKTSNQVICGGCGTMREREDIFYNLSVEVKNLKTVYDSFEKFITGETIEDYFCDTCKKKNSITKRTCLSDLPNVLIIHLQRIVFDLDTLMNQKINTRLEFPHQLNVEPYTKEGLDWREKSKKKNSPTKKKEGAADMGSGEKLRNKQASEGTDKKDDEPDEIEIEDEDYEIIDNEKEGSGKKGRKPKTEEDEVLGPYLKHPKEYYEYRLAGVVVHVGTADFGHYYSYINTNRGDASKKDDDHKNDRWLEYNDSLIKDFDAKDIEAECFGGAGSDSTDDYWSWGKVGREYSKNAYILVYERVLKTPLKLVVKTPEDKQDLSNIFELEKPEVQNQIKIEKATIGEGEDKQDIDNYFYDYYQLERYVSPKIYKNVWEDNHKFMFERHIYTEDFFRFVKEVCNTLKVPEEVHQQQIVNFINPKHTSLSTEVKQSIGNLSNILGVLVFYLLARAHDNNTIPELAEKLKQFLSLNPEAAWTLFDHFVCQDLKNVLELFLNCPEKQVRSATSQLILYTINVIISHYKLTLNVSKPTLTEDQVKALPEEQRHLYTVEDSIVRFLDTLISYIPTEVAKNWLKFGSFLEFWRDFSVSGESQMNYLYQKGFITVLIDFYLGPNSPVPEFSEKKHTMGNRYTEPEFNPLIQTVANMVKRSRVTTKTGAPPYTSLARQGYPVYELSANDMKCLFCSDFYEKTLREKYDPQSFGHIIQHFSFENEGFSQTLAEIILKGLNKANYDDVKPYLEAMSYFISLNDMFQLKRIEWILGYPQPFVSTMRYGSDSFGMYGNNSLEDLIVSYETPLSVENSTSLINLVLQNRKKFENLCISIVRQLLILLDVNHVIFQYVVSLPPPSYNYAKFTDWIPAFIDYFLVEAKKYHYSTYSKEEIGIEAQKYWKSVEEKIKTSVDATRQAWDQVYSQVEGLKSSDDKPAQPVVVASEDKENENKPEEAAESASKKTPLSHIFKPYIIGQTFKEEELGKKIFESSDVPNEVSLVTLEAQCYIADSKPLGVGNLTFPEYLLTDNRLRGIEVDNDSPFALFVQPKGVYEGGKNPLQSDIEAALKSSKNKGNPSEPELRKPLLEDDVDSDKPEDKNEQRSESKPANVVVEGSSGAVEVLDKEEGEIVPKETGAEAQQENIDGKDKTEVKKDEVIKERKREKEDVIELERVVPCQEDFNFVYELNPVVRRFVFHNTSPYSLLCQVRVVPKTNDFLNFRVPASTFRVKVKAQSNACVLAIMKILPEVAWGEYEIECDVSKVEVVGGAKNEPENGGRRKNVQFHIRTIEGAGGYSRDANDII